MPRVIGVCESAACAQSGSTRNIVAIEDIISCVHSIGSEEMPENQIRIMTRGCLGHCENSPNIVFRNPPNKPKVFTKLDSFESIVVSITSMLQSNESIPPINILKVCELHWLSKKIVEQGDIEQSLQIITKALEEFRRNSMVGDIETNMAEDKADSNNSQSNNDNMDSNSACIMNVDYDELEAISSSSSSSAKELQEGYILYTELYISLLLSKGCIYLKLIEGGKALECVHRIFELFKKSDMEEGGEGCGSTEDFIPATAYLLRADALFLCLNLPTQVQQDSPDKEILEHGLSSFSSVTSKIVRDAYQSVVEKDLELKAKIASTSGGTSRGLPSQRRLPYKDMRRVKDTISSFSLL